MCRITTKKATNYNRCFFKMLPKGRESRGLYNLINCGCLGIVIFRRIYVIMIQETSSNDYTVYGIRAYDAAKAILAECRSEKVAKLERLISKEIRIVISEHAIRPLGCPTEFYCTLSELHHDEQLNKVMAVFKNLSAVPPSAMKGIPNYDVDVDFIYQFDLKME